MRFVILREPTYRSGIISNHSPMERVISWERTTLAALTAIALFFALLYLVSPIYEWVMLVYGRIFVPERYGGGTLADDPSLFARGVRVTLISTLSALGAFFGSLWLFANANHKVVAATFTGGILLWVGFLAFFIPYELSFVAAIAVFVILLMAAPPLFIAYFIWRGFLR